MNKLLFRRLALPALMAPLLALLLAGNTALAQAPKTEIAIDLNRFFGSCEGKYGTSTDPTTAVGECGILTTLINQFNATNGQGIVVHTQVSEWGPYYDQLNARLVARDVPAVAVMHESIMGDYVRRGLLQPLDADFAQLGIRTDDFTAHARRGVTFQGQTYALPFDTWSWLWHYNLGLMKQAGLLQADGSPRLPRNPEELLAQARQFRQATGKPLFAWGVANENAANTRTFLTLLFQQGGQLFAADGRSINTAQPEVMRALGLMRQLYREGHVKPNLDYAGANQAFLNGDAGVLLVGTWTIDQFLGESRKPGAALRGGYAVRPFPQLYERPAVFADGHAWVLLKGGTPTPAEHQAALSLLKFLWAHDADWARTGHLPARQSVADSAAFQALPMRSALTEITRTGQAMPGNVAIQRTVENMLGEEIAALLLSDKPVADVAAQMAKRVNAALKRTHRGAPGSH